MARRRRASHGDREGSLLRCLYDVRLYADDEYDIEETERPLTIASHRVITHGNDVRGEQWRRRGPAAGKRPETLNPSKNRVLEKARFWHVCGERLVIVILYRATVSRHLSLFLYPDLRVSQVYRARNVSSIPCNSSWTFCGCWTLCDAAPASPFSFCTVMSVDPIPRIAALMS